MGYETRIDLYSLHVHRQKINEVRKALSAVSRDLKLHWMVGLLSLDADGALTWNDHCVGAWKEHEAFVERLAGCCSRGWISFWSREGDGAAWAYEFDGRGGYQECSARRVSAIKAAETRKRHRAFGNTRERQDKL